MNVAQDISKLPSRPIPNDVRETLLAMSVDAIVLANAKEVGTRFGPELAWGDPLGKILGWLYKTDEEAAWMYMADLLADYRRNATLSPEGKRITLNDLVHEGLGGYLSIYLSHEDIQDFKTKAAVEVPKYFSADPLSVNDR